MSSLCTEAQQGAQLNASAVLDTLEADGPLSMTLKDFEARHEQKQMLRNIVDAFNNNEIALIEAGTGTGKSLAYLIPAMLWALQTKEPTVISTHTINLQEQLLNKDIPLIAKALKLDIKAVLVKGMQNYLCMRKLEDALQEGLLLSPQENEEIHKIDAWNKQNHDGSRSALPFSSSAHIWEKVAAEHDTCSYNRCPHYQQCHFFKARSCAAEAQILIVNHHLLFADLSRRQEESPAGKDAGILPNYSRLILDEAHHIEDVATELLATSISQMDIMRLIARLASEKGGKVSGKLPLLKEKLLNAYRSGFPKEVSSISDRLTITLPGLRRDVLKQTHETFDFFHEFINKIGKKTADYSEEDQQGEKKLRILPIHFTHPHWSERLIPSTKLLVELLQRYCQALTATEMDLKLLKNSRLDEQCKGTMFEISGLASRLLSLSSALSHFVTSTIGSDAVRWIELQTLKSMENTALIDATLDVSKALAQILFTKLSTTILCSATLTSNNQFHFIRQRLGLVTDLIPERSIKEYIYDSPFNFRQQALFAVPTDLPPPGDAAFAAAASEHIWQIVQSSRGNAFILFTSYSMLKICYEMLESRLKQSRFHPLKQGDGDRNFLLNSFKAMDRSVLFGTDSFWEGVDVAGDALRCVIIVKLPFKVPSEPLTKARSEAIAAGGGDPFMDYSLPQAIVKFKQGFGRLIRQRRDRGCIICLDNRLITKRYGAFFLNSLPGCQQVFSTVKSITEQMAEFYKKTHFLTKKG